MDAAVVSPVDADARLVSNRAPPHSGDRAWPGGIGCRGFSWSVGGPSSVLGDRIFARLWTWDHCRHDANYRGDRVSLCLFAAALRAIKSWAGDGIGNGQCGLRIFL